MNTAESTRQPKANGFDWLTAKLTGGNASNRVTPARGGLSKTEGGQRMGLRVGVIFTI